MQKHMHLLKCMVRNAGLTAIVFGGLFFFAGAPSAQARPYVYHPHTVVRVRVGAGFYRPPVIVARRGFYAPPVTYYRYDRPVHCRHASRDRFGHWHRY